MIIWRGSTRLYQLKPGSSTASKSYEYTTKPTDIKTFFTTVPAHSQRAKDITNSILQFIVKDLRPFSVVENQGFKNMISVLEPRYTIPSRQFFSWYGFHFILIPANSRFVFSILLLSYLKCGVKHFDTLSWFFALFLVFLFSPLCQV